MELDSFVDDVHGVFVELDIVVDDLHGVLLGWALGAFRPRGARVVGQIFVEVFLFGCQSTLADPMILMHALRNCLGYCVRNHCCRARYGRLRLGERSGRCCGFDCFFHKGFCGHTNYSRGDSLGLDIEQ